MQPFVFLVVFALSVSTWTFGRVSGEKENQTDFRDVPPPPPPPSCKNVTCKYGTHCELVPVICCCPPCYPQPKCKPNPGALISTFAITCATTLCIEGTYCFMQEIDCGTTPCPSRPACLKPPLTCANVKCKDGFKCVMKDVQCVTAPCFPVPECVPK